MDENEANELIINENVAKSGKLSNQMIPDFLDFSELPG